MVEIISCKIFSLSREEQTLESLQSAGTKNYRLEEVPRDQVELADGDALVPVAHFSKEVFSTFGSPFLVLMRQGDTVGRVKERMQERLGVSDKEWDKYRVAFVLQGKPHYVEEDDKVINTKEFRGMALQSHGPQQAGRPWIGLEHTNKANKRSRYTYMEKSIKIYN
jgi:ubiquitin carboxyl-terminal hydrolase 7